MGLGRGWACIGIQLHDSKTRPWLQGKWGRMGPVRAEWGRVGPSRAGGAGEGLDMHWDSIKLL